MHRYDGAATPTRRAALAGLLGCALAAVGVAAFADPPRAGHPPDPPGKSSRKQWIFSVVYERGRARLTRAEAATLQQPAATARVLGRFAIELWIGKELLDRVRFNVPLTGDDRDPAGSDEAKRRREKDPFRRPSFENVSTRLRVQMADAPRAAWVQILDRATGQADRFWWPPEPDGSLLPMKKPAASDAGAPDAPQDAPNAPTSPPADAAAGG